MLPMHFWIIEQRSWRFLAWRDLTQRFLIRFEQGKDHRCHLPSNTPDHFQLATIILLSFIIGSYAREETLIDASPFTIQRYRPACHEQERLLDRTYPSMSKLRPIKTDVSLTHFRSPTIGTVKHPGRV